MACQGPSLPTESEVEEATVAIMTLLREKHHVDVPDKDGWYLERICHESYVAERAKIKAAVRELIWNDNCWKW